MKTLKVLFLAILFCMASSSIQADIYSTLSVIHLATYNNLQELESKKYLLRPIMEKRVDNHLKKETINGTIYIYLSDTYSPFTGKKIKEALQDVRSFSGFENASIKFISANEYKALEDFKVKSYTSQPTPSQYSTTKSIQPPKKSGNYSVQLGTYCHMKSLQEVATIFGITNLNSSNIGQFIHYEETILNNEKCRRYYYGHYFYEADAEVKMEELERRTGQVLIVRKL